MADVIIKGLEKSYGSTRILNGIDLTISDGEFLVLVGPSGCGKSTLLRMIAGLEPIETGEVYIGGRLANAVHPKDRDVAMVFQSYALYPHMTVRENMGFSLKIRRQAPDVIARAVAQAAELLELTRLLDRLPKQLSGGQRQRVAIGRAIVRKPSVFLFDEPLSNLDANLRAQMRVELKKLHQALGVTMIYVTHDQVEAMTLADRICVLESGYAQQVDTPVTLYEHPVNTFVAEFIGSPPMNFLRAELDEGALFSEQLFVPWKADSGTEASRRHVRVGLRPHELTLDESHPGKVDAVVDVVEVIGWDLHLHCRVGDEPLIAQVPTGQGGRFRPGDTVSFRINPCSVKLFDPDTGRALAARGTE